MKSKRNLERSANARLNQVIRESQRLHVLSVEQKDGFDPERMAKMRSLAHSIGQAVHEFNAYCNALMGEV